MKKIITLLVLLTFAVPMFAGSYSVTYTVKGKRMTQTVNANSMTDAKKLIQNQYAGQKVYISTVKSVTNGKPQPAAGQKTTKPVWVVTFTIDGKRYGQAVYATTSIDAKKQIQNMYPGHKINFSSVKKQ